MTGPQMRKAHGNWQAEEKSTLETSEVRSAGT